MTQQMRVAKDIGEDRVVELRTRSSHVQPMIAVNQAVSAYPAAVSMT